MGRREGGSAATGKQTRPLIADHGPAGPIASAGAMARANGRRDLSGSPGAGAERRRALVLGAGQITWTARGDGAAGDVRDWRLFTGQDAAGAGSWLEALDGALYPEDHPRVAMAWEAAVAAASPYEVDCRIKRRDGAYRRMLVRAVPVLDAAGGVREWVGTAADITGITDMSDHASVTEPVRAPERPDRRDGTSTFPGEQTIAPGDGGARTRAETRLSRLGEVTARFSDVQTLAEVRRIMLGDIVGALDARGAGLRLVRAEDLALADLSLGAPMDEGVLRRAGFVARDAEHPAADAARGGAPIFIGDAAECIRRYPALAQAVAASGSEAVAHLPLRRGVEVFGVLSLDFAAPRVWDEAERAFALALGARAAVSYERARLFEAERDARRRLETVLEVLPAAVIIANAQGKLLHVNRAFRDTWGEHALAGDMAEYRIYPGWHPDARPMATEDWAMTRTLRRGETVRGQEVEIQAFDGTRKTILNNAAPLRDDGGTITGGVVAFVDITERRALELEAADRAALMKATFEAMTDMVTVMDAEGHVILQNASSRVFAARFANPEYLASAPNERTNVLVSRDVSGRPLTPEELPSRRVLRGEALAAGEAQLAFHAPNGAPCYVSVTGAPLRDAGGAITGAVLVSRDVTERKLLERRTREALGALLELAAAMVGDPLAGDPAAGDPSAPRCGDGAPPGAALDAAQRADDLLGRFATMCGRVLGCERIAIVAVEPGTEVLRPVSITGSSAERERIFRAGFSDLRLADRFGDAVAAQLMSGETALVDVESLPMDDPARVLSRRYFLIAPMLGAGALYGYIGVNFGDEAERYTAENRALALAVAQLAGTVMERARLARERAEAEARGAALAKATRRMDDFLGIASHELRTPLTGIKANVQMAGRHVRGLSQSASMAGVDGARSRVEQTAMLLERADRQTARLDRLVGDLLDVSRIQAGKLELRLDTCDLAEIVRDTAREQRLAWSARAIVVDLPRGATFAVRADADRIGQVVANFLTNALKYSADDQAVTVRGRVRGGRARVAVRDRGPGLAAAERARVWERFYRVPGIEPRSGAGGGLGLGLYICREIIERHGGEVGVESAPGEGSTFWFALPLATGDRP
jgi:PAS domain S-box-containing protein